MPFNTYHIGFSNFKFDFEATMHFVFLSSVKYRRETKNTSPIELQVDFRMNSYMNDVQCFFLVGTILQIYTDLFKRDHTE
jgi:hypothetical protein